jgi:hypothetical protein
LLEDVWRRDSTREVEHVESRLLLMLVLSLLMSLDGHTSTGLGSWLRLLLVGIRVDVWMTYLDVEDLSLGIRLTTLRVQ